MNVKNDKTVNISDTKAKKTKVLFALSEADPFIKTGGLGDVGGSLPQALSREGVDVCVFLPKFSRIAEEYTKEMEFLGSLYVTLSWRRIYLGLFRLVHNGITYYFLDNEHYFKREMFYGYGDDAERMAFFSKGILEALPLVGEFPDIIHCHDWHTALLPVMLREDFQGQENYKDIKTVFTVHNLKYQGVFPGNVLGDVLGLHYSKAASDQLRYWDAVNFMRGALLYSDKLTTVSPTYAEEIKTAYFGENMDAIFRDRASILTGILNGINTKMFSSKTDKDIYVNYDIDSLELKIENKTNLQKELGLPVNEDIPLLCIISRLTEQKGLDLVTHIMNELLEMDVQIAVLGTGDAKFEEAFHWFATNFPDKVSSYLKFNEALSHKFYASADMLLMPSRFEPCGLSQMIAMGYGTIPIVRKTGGLSDSVIPFDEDTLEGNGFVFENYNAHELLFSIKEAVSIYSSDFDAWNALVKNALTTDFTWDTSAKKYIEIYNDLLDTI